MAASELDRRITVAEEIMRRLERGEQLSNVLDQARLLMNMADETRYTDPIRCRHCGNTAPMKVSAVVSQVRNYEDAHSGMPWEEGPVHEVLICPACDGRR